MISTVTNKDVEGDEELVETVRKLSIGVVQKVDRSAEKVVDKMEHQPGQKRQNQPDHVR